MSNTIIVGQIQTATTATAGTIKALDGTVYSYSDSTLSTRSIALELGEYVIFAYDTTGPVTVGVTPLTDIYADGLTDATEDNEITAADIQRSLRINNACASYKGAQWITKQDQMIPCDELINDARTMVSMIDSVTSFIPEGEVISGRQATYMFTFTSGGNAAINMDVVLTIGTATYSRTILAGAHAVDDIATNLATYINTFYPQNYPYYAEASGTNLIISGSDFDASNGTAVAMTLSTGAVTSALPNTLANGSAEVEQGENSISNQEIIQIINRLDALCSTPCLDVVAFEA
jgi:hypothetical protein